MYLAERWRANCSRSTGKPDGCLGAGCLKRQASLLSPTNPSLLISAFAIGVIPGIVLLNASREAENLPPSSGTPQTSFVVMRVAA